MIEYLIDDQIIKPFHFLPEGNATSAYYPILIYLWAKLHQSKNILEVGLERGYGAYYLAQAAKIYGGMYYGIDIDPDYCKKVDDALTQLSLPHKIICADTKKLDKIDFTDRIDIAFLDGEHNTEAVIHEVELIYPLLTGKGFGFIFLHDIVDCGNADAWWKLKNDSRFETLGTNPNYGLGIIRNMKDMESYESLAKRLGILTNVDKPTI